MASDTASSCRFHFPLCSVLSRATLCYGATEAPIRPPSIHWVSYMEVNSLWLIFVKLMLIYVIC